MSTKTKKRIRLATTIHGLFELSAESGRTDAANAARFIERYHRRLLYVPQWGRWLAWDGRRWADDSGVGVMQLAVRYARSLWLALGAMAEHLDRDELGTLQTFVKASNQAGKIQAFLQLAQFDERVICPVDKLNTHRTRLNVLNGTIDLDSGTLRAHCPGDHLTQVANVRFDANANCPEWHHTMELVFGADAELIRYVQQLLGYSCSGLVDEHVLPICYGTGRNGKSTIWNVVESLLGDYAKSASQDLLLPVTQQHPTIVADLYQRRFVPIAEPEQGRALAESLAKTLTGGDVISARRMREDYWTFKPTHKIWIATNHRPQIRGTDFGIWRRIKLIPFTVDIGQRTTPRPGMAQWLFENEGPGILNWLLAGYRDWRQNGFAEPLAVVQATADYRADEDSLGEFLSDFCIVEPKAVATATELFERYQATGGKWSKTAFGRAMAERFDKDKPKSGEHRDKTIYRGIRLRTETDENTGNFANGTSWDQSTYYPIGICANSIEQIEQLIPTSPNGHPADQKADPVCECGGAIFRGICDRCDKVHDPAALQGLTL